MYHSPISNLSSSQLTEKGVSALFKSFLELLLPSKIFKNRNSDKKPSLIWSLLQKMLLLTDHACMN